MLLTFLCFIPVLAQENLEEIVKTKVNEALKNLDWGGIDKYNKQNELQISKSSPDAVFMGDSITEGWSVFLPEFFSNNNYINRGIGGQTTSQMLIRFRQDVINLKPKSVVILAGINDIARNNKFYSLEIIAENIFSMVELAKINGIVPIICSVLPADEFSWNPDISPADSVIKLNTLLKAYANKNQVIYLNYFDEMDNNNGGLRVELTSDGVHVTEKGYELMSVLAKQSVSTAFK
tara:strand:- start:225 stop:929 length:705 start_codon:yes stop_codon:yes gene_type:complete